MIIFECKHCSFISDYKDSSAPKECPECTYSHYTLHFGEKARKYLSKVRHSYALGCNPNEIPKFQKKWPWMKFTPDGRCTTESYAERKRVMKARGFTDLQ
jgi:hypothetical protein